MATARVTLTETQMRAFRLSTLAISLHLKWYFRDILPKKYFFWRDSSFDWVHINLFSSHDLGRLGPEGRWAGIRGRLTTRDGQVLNVRTEVAFADNSTCDTKDVNVRIHMDGHPNDAKWVKYLCGGHLPVLQKGPSRVNDWGEPE